METQRPNVAPETVTEAPIEGRKKRKVVAPLELGVLGDLPRELQWILLRNLLRDVKSPSGMKTLVRLSGTTRELHQWVLGQVSRVTANRRRFRDHIGDDWYKDEKRDAKTNAAFAIWCRTPGFFAALPEEAAALVLGPAPEWREPDWYAEGGDDSYEPVMARNEQAAEAYGESIKALGAPPSALAFAAVDMISEQRRFFFGQLFGQMIVEEERSISIAGAAKLGEFLGSFPLLTDESDFLEALEVVEEIQQNKDDAASYMRMRLADAETPADALQYLRGHYTADGRPILHPEHRDGNLSIALILSWSKTEVGKPSTWPLQPSRQRGQRGAFVDVVKQLCEVMPLQVEQRDGHAAGHVERPENLLQGTHKLQRLARDMQKVVTKWIRRLEAQDFSDPDAWTEEVHALKAANKEVAVFCNVMREEAGRVVDEYRAANASEAAA